MNRVCDKQNPDTFIGDNTRNSVYYETVKELLDEYSVNSLVTESLTEKERVALNYNTLEINSFVSAQLVDIGEEEFSSNYEFLFKKIKQLPIITDPEILEFSKYVGLSIFLLPTLIKRDKPETLLVQLNNFYSPYENYSYSSINSFCSLVPNIFAKVQEMQSKFNNVLGYLSIGSKILDQIQDFSVASLIESLKSQILGVIDTIIMNFKARLENISASFMSIANFKYNLNAIADRYRVLRDRARSFAGDDTEKTIKDKFEGLILQAVSFFDLTVMTIQEIQFLILKFCELVSNVENFFDGLLVPIQNLKNNYVASYAALKSSSNIATANALGAGAYRMQAAERYGRIEEARQIPPSVYRGSSTLPSGFTVAAGREVTDVREGTSIPVRKRSGSIIPPTPEELDAIPSFEEARAGKNGIRYNPGPTSAAEGRSGWEKVQTLEIVMLMRLARRMGRELVINSAYRSKPVKATRSWHMSGQAFDISTRGWSSSDRNNLISFARAEGFGGIGKYSTFIHVDSGTVRSWGG